MDRLYAERQKNYSHANRRNAGGSVDEGRSQSGILLPLMCCLVVDTVTEGLDGNGCYTLGYALSSLSTGSSGSLCMEQQW